MYNNLLTKGGICMLTNEQVSSVLNGRPAVRINSIHLSADGSYYFLDYKGNKLTMTMEEYEMSIKFQNAIKRLCSPTMKVIEIFRQVFFVQEQDGSIYRVTSDSLEYVPEKLFNKRVKSFHRRELNKQVTDNEAENTIRLG